MFDSSITFDSATQTIRCHGIWTLAGIGRLEAQWSRLLTQLPKAVTVDAADLVSIDSAGALFMQTLLTGLKSQGHEITELPLPQQVVQMMALVKQSFPEMPAHPSSNLHKCWQRPLIALGKEGIAKLKQVMGLLALMGELAYCFAGACFSWRRFRYHSIVHVIEHAGLRALPIVGLLAVLIGVVLCYQMGLQLKTYGANIYIVYLTGFAVTREFAPLITAVIMAGRTGSSFTAELGSMKVNEELDALLTMGLSRVELLVLPRVIGLVMVFPLMIFWADLFGIFGAMLMSKSMLGIGFATYLHHLRVDVGAREVGLGLLKAPVFALLIAFVGCYQGFQVKGSADSVGLFTTKSVVQAIFLIIVTDAVFSVIYSWFGL